MEYGEEDSSERRGSEEKPSRFACCCACCVARWKLVTRWFAEKYCKPGSTCATMCSPTYWAKRVALCLNRLVNRQAVTTFAVFELCASMWAIAFYFNFKEVVAADSFLDSAVILLAISFFRVMSALQGGWAAWNRYVSRTRFYWAMVMLNLLLSIPVMAPIWSCRCSCVYSDGFQVDPQQCEALSAYLWLEGRSNTTTDDDNGCAPVVPRTSSLGRAWPELAFLVPERAAAGAGRHTPPGVEATARETLRDLMSQFNATHAGIEWTPISGNEEHVNLTGTCQEPFIIQDNNEAEIYRNALRDLQCSGELTAEFPDVVVRKLRDVMAACAADLECEVVQITIEARLGITQGTSFKTCGLRKPAIPHLDWDALRQARICSLSHDNCLPELPEPTTTTLPVPTPAPTPAPTPKPTPAPEARCSENPGCEDWTGYCCPDLMGDNHTCCYAAITPAPTPAPTPEPTPELTPEPTPEPTQDNGTDNGSDEMEHKLWISSEAGDEPWSAEQLESLTDVVAALEVLPQWQPLLSMDVGLEEPARTPQPQDWPQTRRATATLIASEACRYWKLSLMKKAGPRQEVTFSDTVRTYCLIINITTIVLFLILFIATIAMTIVIYRFIEGHCGDEFVTTNQFHVDFSESQAFDDDFEVGTWVSVEEKQRRRAQRLGQSTMGSAVLDRVSEENSAAMSGTFRTSLPVGDTGYDFGDSPYSRSSFDRGRQGGTFEMTPRQRSFRSGYTEGTTFQGGDSLPPTARRGDHDQRQRAFEALGMDRFNDQDMFQAGSSVAHRNTPQGARARSHSPRPQPMW